MALVMLPSVDALQPVLEDEPSKPSNSIEDKTLGQIRDEKESRQHALFTTLEDGEFRPKSGDDTPAMPMLRRCVVSCRGGVLFRACVAREADTPLTELHLMQPVLGLLLVMAILFMLSTVAVMVGLVPLEGVALRGLELASAGLAAMSAAALLYVGMIARSVPTHEELNVALTNRIDGLDGSVDSAKANATDAEALEGMTLGWVKARGADRDAVRALSRQLREDTAALWAFQFKSQLLRYLSRGEQQRYRQDSAALLQALRESGATLAQYETDRERLLPNGRLSAEELRRIADVVRQTEQDSAFDFLDEVIYSLCDGLETARAPADGVEGTHAPLLRVASAVLPANATWSYSEVIESVYHIAKAPPFAERFAAFARDRIGDGGGDSEPLPHPPSPPPSPPAPLAAAGRATSLIALFVFIEANKPLLLRQAWKAGVAAIGASGVLVALGLATETGATYSAVAGAVVAVGSSLVGWWVCNNKKDDLVMQRQVARFGNLLEELDAAEERLRSSLETMLACDTDMQQLTSDIAAATGDAQQQLDAIRTHNERAIKGERRNCLDSVLIALTDVDGSMSMGPTERRKLLRLLAHMAGRPPAALRGFHTALGLRRIADDDVASIDEILAIGATAPAPCGPAPPPATLSQDAGAHGPAVDDEREYTTKEILDTLEALGAFEVIMGLDEAGRSAREEQARPRKLVWRESWREQSQPTALKGRRREKGTTTRQQGDDVEEAQPLHAGGGEEGRGIIVR